MHYMHGKFLKKLPVSFDCILSGVYRWVQGKKLVNQIKTTGFVQFQCF